MISLLAQCLACACRDSLFAWWLLHQAHLSPDGSEDTEPSCSLAQALLLGGTAPGLPQNCSVSPSGSCTPHPSTDCLSARRLAALH